MIYVTLFIEFFKIGLFAIGGGLATIPFLFQLTEKFDWFDVAELTNMIAVSESTPGPLGINMATYAGIQAAGLFGGIVATLGLVVPSLFIIILISKILEKFKTNPYVSAVFYGLRPAVAAMIFSFLCVLLEMIVYQVPPGKPFFIQSILFLCYLILVFRFKCHPIFFICLGAFMGILLEL